MRLIDNGNELGLLKGFQLILIKHDKQIQGNGATLKIIKRVDINVSDFARSLKHRF